MVWNSSQWRLRTSSSLTTISKESLRFLKLVVNLSKERNMTNLLSKIKNWSNIAKQIMTQWQRQTLHLWLLRILWALRPRLYWMSQKVYWISLSSILNFFQVSSLASFNSRKQRNPPTWCGRTAKSLVNNNTQDKSLWFALWLSFSSAVLCSFYGSQERNFGNNLYSHLSTAQLSRIFMDKTWMNVLTSTSMPLKMEITRYRATGVCNASANSNLLWMVLLTLRICWLTINQFVAISSRCWLLQHTGRLSSLFQSLCSIFWSKLWSRNLSTRLDITRIRRRWKSLWWSHFYVNFSIQLLSCFWSMLIWVSNNSPHLAWIMELMAILTKISSETSVISLFKPWLCNRSFLYSQWVSLCWHVHVNAVSTSALAKKANPLDQPASPITSICIEAQTSNFSTYTQTSCTFATSPSCSASVFLSSSQWQCFTSLSCTSNKRLFCITRTAHHQCIMKGCTYSV